MEEVRNVRNDLFHFRREIGIEDYKKLRYCSDWLARHPSNPSANDAYNYDDGSDDEQLSTTENVNLEKQKGEDIEENSSKSLLETEVINRFLEDDKEYNRYTKLIEDLITKSREKKVTYTFKQIENIIEEKLPQGAKRDRSWWSNHESQPWVEQAWYVLHIDMIRETVIFVRKPYAKEYTDFFQSILSELSEKELPFEVRIPYQDGRHYTTVTAFPTFDDTIGNLTYSFNDIYKNFRIELFINKNNRDQNEIFYNEFFERKFNIEEKLIRSNDLEYMKWEPRETSSALRISLCYNKQIVITDEEQELELLKQWAKEAIISFYNVLIESYREFLKDNSTKNMIF